MYNFQQFFRSHVSKVKVENIEILVPELVQPSNPVELTWKFDKIYQKENVILLDSESTNVSILKINCLVLHYLNMKITHNTGKTCF